MGFGKDGTGAIIRESVSITLGTLGSRAAAVSTPLVLGEDFRILKTEVFAHVQGLTATEGEGLLLGYANGELSASETAEAINADGPLDRNDAVPGERAMRMAKLIGEIMLGQSDSQIRAKFVGEQGGSPIIAKPRWTFSNPEGWQWFIYNSAADALQTGAVVQITATHYGVWVT